MWPDVFPADIQFSALPDQTVDLYRDWTLFRTEHAPEEIIDLLTWNDSRLHALPDEGHPSTHGVVRPYPFSGRFRDRTLQEALRAQGIDVERTRHERFGNGGTSVANVVYVFPHQLLHYGVTVPLAAAEGLKRGPGGIEVDLQIDGVEFIVAAEERSVLVHLTPREVRLVNDGTVVWRGEMQVIPPK